MTNSHLPKNEVKSNADCAAKLTGSLLLFTRTFFKCRTGRTFELSNPLGRESHYITICRALTKIMRGETERLIINVPPRYAKTELLIHFVAWALSIYPDCNFLYTSYSHTLAAKQTATIRDILTLREYASLFHVELNQSSHAKFDFETTAGGSVYASGIGGTITGRGAGIKNCNRFGGAIIIDDAHKPAEAHSDTIRESVIEWYSNTLRSRRNDGTRTPIIFIGQRVHESDLAAYLINEDHEDWEVVSLPALDVVGNALHPKMHSVEELREMEKHDVYNFASQYQQNPQPAGGGIFKEEWFRLLPQMPEIIATFITCDTAETDKTYNDATVLSFWGIHKIKYKEIDIEMYGLVWLNCWEIWVEPKDLENEFMQFYGECMRFPVKPKIAAIEKKSTGVTLGSILDEMPGLQIIKIDRTGREGSKTQRFLEIQPLIASHQVSFVEGAKHADMCIKHCGKITANNTHRYDDIADTLYDAVKLALIDQTIVNMYISPERDKNDKVITQMLQNHRRLQQKRGNRSWLT